MKSFWTIPKIKPIEQPPSAIPTIVKLLADQGPLRGNQIMGKVRRIVSHETALLVEDHFWIARDYGLIKESSNGLAWEATQAGIALFCSLGPMP